jgi:hypothetical protein
MSACRICEAKIETYLSHVGPRPVTRGSPRDSGNGLNGLLPGDAA